MNGRNMLFFWFLRIYIFLNIHNCVLTIHPLFSSKRCLGYFFTVLFGVVTGSQWLSHDDDPERQVALHLWQRGRVPGSLHGEYKRVCACGCFVSVCLARNWINILCDRAGVSFGNDITSHSCDVSTPDDARMSNRLAALRRRITTFWQEYGNKKLRNYIRWR